MKLNLRDLFWLILVAAVATMWWMDRTRLAAELASFQWPPPGGYVEVDDPFTTPIPKPDP
jgi:hypothetical protein